MADRVVQQATVQVIGPGFEVRFTPSSFGYRPGRSARDAVGWVREAIRRGDRWVAEFDIVGFLRQMIADLNPLIRGWGNYFVVGNVAKLFEQLDEWIRMRLRSKVRGSKATAISNRKMPTKVLRGLGLVSLEDLRRTHLSPA